MSGLVLGLYLLTGPGLAQDTLRLPALQAAAVQRDPRAARLRMEEAATDLRLRNIAVERLPGFTVTGEAIHQSEVAAIPVEVPGRELPRPPHERYEAAVNADWLLYGGGAIGARREVERADLAVRRAELAAELYPLRMEVTEAYFRALLLQERYRERSTLIEDLEARLAETREQVAAGAALPGDTAAVRAEVLRAVQDRSQVAADRQAALEILSELTGRAISGAELLTLPVLDDDVARLLRASDDTAPAGQALPLSRSHPRYAVFEAQRRRLAQEAAVVRARSRPRASAFGALAYGRPGLRQFTRDFHDYWLAGVRVQWTPWDWGSTGRELETLRVRERMLQTEEAAFSDRLLRQIQQPLRDVQRLRSALEIDRQIIALREQVERQARVQLAERAITAAAYVDARTDLHAARLALVRHRVELARAQAEILTTLGVELR